MVEKPLNALIVSNGIEGLDQLYKSNQWVQYEVVEVGANFRPDLSSYDILVAPNGTDHIALYRLKEEILDFLAAGKTLLCFDGWFTDWVPGNRWIMDNTKKTIEVRYKIKDDPFGFGQKFSIKDLTYSNGISGWWACGFIEAAEKATVFMEDTWGRPLVVVDEQSTAGTMVLSASGPLADFSYATTDDDKAYAAMTDLYHAILQYVYAKNRKQ